jgi:gas vesicle protein
MRGTTLLRTGREKEVMVMKEETTNIKRSILMPVLIGSSIAAGIALLLAPKKGKEIRKDLKRFAVNTRDQVAEVIDGGRDLFKEGRTVVAEAVKAGTETFDEGTEKLKKLMHKKERSFVAPILASGVIGVGTAVLLAPKAGKRVGVDLKRIAAKTRGTFVSAIDKGKAFYTEGRKAIPKAMRAGQKEYIRKNVMHRHAA